MKPSTSYKYILKLKRDHFTYERGGILKDGARKSSMVSYEFQKGDRVNWRGNIHGYYGYKYSKKQRKICLLDKKASIVPRRMNYTQMHKTYFTIEMAKCQEKTS